MVSSKSQDLMSPPTETFSKTLHPKYRANLKQLPHLTVGYEPLHFNGHVLYTKCKKSCLNMCMLGFANE